MSNEVSTPTAQGWNPTAGLGSRTEGTIATHAVRGA